MCTGEGLAGFMRMACGASPFVIFRRLGFFVKGCNLLWQRAACFYVIFF